MSERKSTIDLAREWIEAVQLEARCRQRFIRSQCDVTNTMNALARQLAPSYMKTGEVVSCWCRFDDKHEECVVVVCTDASGSGSFTVETRGKRKLEAA